MVYSLQVFCGIFVPGILSYICRNSKKGAHKIIVEETTFDKMAQGLLQSCDNDCTKRIFGVQCCSWEPGGHVRVRPAPLSERDHFGGRSFFPNRKRFGEVRSRRVAGKAKLSKTEVEVH